MFNEHESLNFIDTKILLNVGTKHGHFVVKAKPRMIVEIISKFLQLLSQSNVFSSSGLQQNKTEI